MSPTDSPDVRRAYAQSMGKNTEADHLRKDRDALETAVLILRRETTRTPLSVLDFMEGLLTGVRRDFEVARWDAQQAGDALEKARAPYWKDNQYAAVLLILEDSIAYPDGHPCRDCGHLHWEHVDNDLDCDGWR